MIEQILSKFPDKKAKNSEDCESALEGELVDARCEAEVLAKMVADLDKKTQFAAEQSGKRRKTDEHEKMKDEKDLKDETEKKDVQHGQFEALTTKPDFSKDVIPARTTLRVYQGLANPYVQGKLPVGVLFKGQNSMSRSFAVTASKVAGTKRTELTEGAAKAQVVSWLWDWAKSQDGSG